ncbi:MAG: monovalent cation/H+ antiporter complex subunit F [Opitutales bacterium]
MAFPMASAFIVASLFFVLALGLAMIRVVKGPTVFERIVALDLIGGVCMSLFIFFAIYFEEVVFLDVAFAIAVVSFLGTVAFARYLERGEAQ